MATISSNLSSTNPSSSSASNINEPAKYRSKKGKENAQKAELEKLLVQLVEEIKTRPSPNEQEQQPEELKSVLKKHQLHALKFMMWRESRTPSGGILADEAGLGKTQAVIGFILRSKETDTTDNPSNSEPNKLHGRNLIICSGNFVKEWEEKLQTYVKPNRLSVNVFHGTKRTCRIEELAMFDVVLTSQELVTSEFKREGILFKLKLDYSRQSARHPQLHNSFVADLRALSKASLGNDGSASSE